MAEPRSSPDREGGRASRTPTRSIQLKHRDRPALRRAARRRRRARSRATRRSSRSIRRTSTALQGARAALREDRRRWRSTSTSSSSSSTSPAPTRSASRSTSAWRRPGRSSSASPSARWEALEKILAHQRPARADAARARAPVPAGAALGRAGRDATPPHQRASDDPATRVELYAPDGPGLRGGAEAISIAPSRRTTTSSSFDADNSAALDALAALYEKIEDWDRAIDIAVAPHRDDRRRRARASICTSASAASTRSGCDDPDTAEAALRRGARASIRPTCRRCSR